jgi:hypothetical protein
MGSRTISISSCLSTSSHLKTRTDKLHNLVNVGDMDLGEPNNIDLLFSVFTAGQMISVIEQIVKLTAINFIKTCHQSQFLLSFQQLDNVVSRHQIKPGHATVLCPHHGPSLS